MHVTTKPLVIGNLPASSSRSYGSTSGSHGFTSTRRLGNIDSGSPSCCRGNRSGYSKAKPTRLLIEPLCQDAFLSGRPSANKHFRHETEERQKDSIYDVRSAIRKYCSTCTARNMSS